jgi:hypothetical protein
MSAFEEHCALKQDILGLPGRANAELMHCNIASRETKASVPFASLVYLAERPEKSKNCLASGNPG